MLNTCGPATQAQAQTTQCVSEPRTRQHSGAGRGATYSGGEVLGAEHLGEALDLHLSRSHEVQELLVLRPRRRKLLWGDELAVVVVTVSAIAIAVAISAGAGASARAADIGGDVREGSHAVVSGLLRVGQGLQLASQQPPEHRHTTALSGE